MARVSDNDVTAYSALENVSYSFTCLLPKLPVCVWGGGVVRESTKRCLVFGCKLFPDNTNET